MTADAGADVTKKTSTKRAVGVLAMEHIAVGLVEDHRLVGPLRIYPEESAASSILHRLPAEQIAEAIRAGVERVAGVEGYEAVGVGFPGVVRNGVVEESPNLQQVKGFALQTTLSQMLGSGTRVFALNDADAFAAGIAATRGHLDTLIRVWTLGSGVGFGRYPNAEGVWEGGHVVVSLDPRENYCGCGGHGHLEGIVGQRAMRLRFLDLEPDEVFASAREGDARCATFVKMWHRALAAATATSIHLEGPGRFFFSGPHATEVDVRLLELYLHEMVKMSPLQGSQLEIVEAGDEMAIIGAAVHALRLRNGS
jgi:glucokinase